MRNVKILQENLEGLFTIASFEVTSSKAFSKSFNIELKSCGLNNPSPIKWEGLYGEIPQQIDNMVTGICLWDSRWKLEFFNKKKVNQPGAVKVLALEIPRKEAHQYIKEGRQIKSLTIPIGLGRYHNSYLKWLQESIRKLNIKQIFIHVPIAEYHFYINEFEEQINRSLPEIHNSLDDFGKSMTDKLKLILDKSKIKYSFIDPMNDYKVKDPVESYKFPYNHLPQLYPNESFFSFEDISEFKLASGSPIKNGIFGVLDFPDPYLDKQTTNDNSKTFILH